MAVLLWRLWVSRGWLRLQPCLLKDLHLLQYQVVDIEEGVDTLLVQRRELAGLKGWLWGLRGCL